MKILIGTYDAKLDAHGRLMLPKGLRDQLKDIEDEGFVLTRAVFFDNLELYPRREWEKWMKRILRLKKTSPKKVRLISAMNAGARLLYLDGHGRLQLPKDLIRKMNLGKEVVIASEGNILQIWDKDAYERFLEESREVFPQLVEELLDEDDEEA
ncbi:MAG: division/cell wall cluster transcriptional repressor MraZ [Chlorobi bacterium]|nr:division/cell wall cluster transcriptional repressor MraZ [Chlorobiota bacterium]